MTSRPPDSLNVAITGHRQLGDKPQTLWHVHAQCVRILDRLHDVARLQGAKLMAHSALAAGADQIFARAAVGLGLPLAAIIPFADYPDDFVGTDRREFDLLLSLCCQVHRLPRKRRSNDAYLAAGQWLVDHCDYLVAVWNGKPAAGAGGTADVVAYARKKRRPIFVIDPTAFHAPKSPHGE